MSASDSIRPLPVETADSAPIKLRRPMRDDAEMDITPMIDITFLLLIYFLVASRIDVDAAVRLPGAQNGTAVAAKESVVVTIAGEGDEALVYLSDGRDEAALIQGNLEQQNQRITDYVQRGLRGELPGGGEPKHFVLIKAQRDLKHREVARVIRAAGMAEDDIQLFVAVMEEK